MFSTDHREYVTQCDYRVLPKKCRLFKNTNFFVDTPQPEKDEKLIKIIQCDLFNHYSTLGSGSKYHRIKKWVGVIRLHGMKGMKSRLNNKQVIRFPLQSFK